MSCAGTASRRSAPGSTAPQPFIPTQQEIDDARQRAESASALAEIERTYPLPVMESMTLAYLHTRSGRIMVHKYAGKDKEGEDVWLPVATPFGVPARRPPCRPGRMPTACG